MDEFLKPPGTRLRGLFIENRIDELVAQMAPDVALDYKKWANPWPWGGQEGYPRDQSFAYAIGVLKNDYLAVRRTHLFVTHNVDKVASYKIAGSYSAAIPNAQPANPSIKFGAYDYNPASGNQDEEYIELKNPNTYAVDISGWGAGRRRGAHLPARHRARGGREPVRLAEFQGLSQPAPSVRRAARADSCRATTRATCRAGARR